MSAEAKKRIAEAQKLRWDASKLKNQPAPPPKAGLKKKQAPVEPEIPAPQPAAE